MSTIHAIDQADNAAIAGKRVLFRADVNVPLVAGKISDDTRLRRTAPGIADIAAGGGQVIVISHLGRPKGKPAPDMSLAPVAGHLAEVLKKPVRFIASTIGKQAAAATASMKNGDVVMLENLRFHSGEESNDAVFAQALANLADIYVNDAFACSHRSHASITGVAKLLPCYGGRLLMEELVALDKALTNPARPLLAIVGGSKISTKLAVLSNLLGRVDVLAIGGAMANTFLLAAGLEVGASLVEKDMTATAQKIMTDAKAAKCDLILPVDGLVASQFAEGVATASVPLSADTSLAADKMILDIGRVSVATITKAVDATKTVIWNGPLGAFETPPFDKASLAIAHHIAQATKAGKLVSIAGGGDTVAVLNKAGGTQDFTYVSTAGGAFLEWMEGKQLPGVEALRR